MATINTVVTESKAGQLARQAAELAREMADVLQQMAPTDAFLTPWQAATGRAVAIAKALRRAEAELVKSRLELRAAEVAANIAEQDRIISAP